MTKRKFIDIFRRQRKSAGFTLIELLVTVMVGWIVISGLIYFVVQLLRSDRQEFARTQTDQEMGIALNYIASELKEAIYIYEGECLGTAARGAPSTTTTPNPGYCPGLKSAIASTQLPATLTPILAFWKLEAVPYPSSAQLPGDCDSFTGDKLTECQKLLITRSSYTLVVYSVDTAPNTTWEGPARIVRYQMRQYSNLSTLQQTTGYCPPSDATFTSWPRTNAGQPLCSNGTPNYVDDVLVDLVDNTKSPATCPNPTDYSTSPPVSSNLGFLACVRRPIDLTTGGTQLQDVIIYIRGNAVKRAGVSIFNSPSFYPTVQAQVKARSTLTRIPPPLQ